MVVVWAGRRREREKVVRGARRGEMVSKREKRGGYKDVGVGGRECLAGAGDGGLVMVTLER